MTPPEGERTFAGDARASEGPVRTCCGCGARDRQAALVRLAVAPSGTLIVDSGRRHGGRGAYLHRRRTCWEGFVKGRLYVRSLRRNVPRSERAAVADALRRGAERNPRGGASPSAAAVRAGITGDAGNASA